MKQHGGVVFVSALLAVIGVAATYRLYPSTEAIAEDPVTLSRGEAVEKAKALATRYGRDVSSWDRPTVISSRDWFVDEVRSAAPAMARSRIHAQTYSVAFTRGPEFVLVKLLGNGTPTEFSYRNGMQPQYAGSPLRPAQEAMVLTDFGCEDRDHYRKASSVESARAGHVTTWEWRDAHMPEYAEQIEVRSAADGVRFVKLKQDWSDSLQKKWLTRQNRSGYRELVLPAVVAIAVGLTCTLFFPGWARGRVKVRAAVRLGLAVLAIAVVRFVAGGGFDRTSQLAALNSEALPEAVFRALLLPIVTAAWLSAAWAAGRSLMVTHGASLGRWHTLDAILDGRWFRREVGAAVASGLLAGAALTAIPAVLCALPLFANPQATTTAVNWLAAPVPFLAALIEPIDVGLVLFLVVPFLATAKSRKWTPLFLQYAAMGALAIVGTGFQRGLVNDDLVGTVVTGAALAGGFVAIYWYAGLLAALAANVGLWAAKIAVYFLHQPSEVIQASGFTVALGYGAIALAGVAMLVWAPAMEPAPEEDSTEIAAQREIFNAEFSLARDAQQRMLPDVPARLGEFTLAASCHPARDVGGDLYDFFRYPDGSYGICVADVSGKGVPAALYMTMTKGILAAASRELADLRGLAVALNGYLHAAGRKKTFVTMALGRLDPERRLLEHVRAGHNSILWRRTSRGESCYVKPRGVGLGLTSNLLFERALAMDRLEMEPGDVVVFYSDGITEAMNPALELFGEERLEETVRLHAALDASGLEREILREVRAFMAGEPVHDDMTLFVLRA